MSDLRSDGKYTAYFRIYELVEPELLAPDLFFSTYLFIPSCI